MDPELQSEIQKMSIEQSLSRFSDVFVSKFEDLERRMRRIEDHLGIRKGEPGIVQKKTGYTKEHEEWLKKKQLELRK